jgi:hypothetical protein
MADGQNTGDSLPESQEATEGLNNLGGLIDQAGLARVFGSTEETEQEATEPEPTPPADEAEEGVKESDSPESSDSGTDESETESKVLSNSEDDDEPVDVKGQDGLLKRISKLTAIRRETEDKVTTLEDENATLRSQLEQKDEQSPAVVNKSNPFGDVRTLKDVESKLQEAQEVYDWAEDHPNGVTQGEKDYSEEDILGIKRRARQALRELPKRREYLSSERENSRLVDDAFPYWKDRSHAMYQQAQEILRNRPEIKNHAEWKADVTIYQLGLMAYSELQNSKGKKTKVAKATAQPSKPAAAPRNTDADTKRKTNAVKNFTERRDRDSLTELMKGFI